MKKQLLAGTAIVAASVFIAGGAVAADKKMMKPSLSLGGYWHQHVGGILDEDADLPETSAIDVRNDAEIYIKGSAKLDNGIKISTFSQLENGNDADYIDEYGITVSGSFGQITMGGTENAPTRMVTGFIGSWATGVGETLNFDSDDWTKKAPGVNFGTMQHSRLSTGDGEKIIYVTPKFEGFQLGASYQPDASGPGGEDHAQTGIPNADTGAHDSLAGAITYSGKFGEVGLGAGVGVLNVQGANMGGEDVNAWNVGARIDFGSARIAAGYKRTSDPEAARGYIADVGVRYSTGANAFSVTGSHGEMEAGANDGATYSAVMGSYARTLGPGVRIAVNLIWNESESADGATNYSSLAGVTSLLVGF